MAIGNEIEGFLSVLRRSGLLPEGREEALLAEMANQGVYPTDVRSLAEAFVRREILTAWQAEMLLHGKHRGFHLGPYVILQTLGKGAMGSVFLAQHVLMRRRCAIKVLPFRSREDRDLLERFQLEARVLAALDHPNIVRAYDFNKDISTGSEVYYLVMGVSQLAPALGASRRPLCRSRRGHRVGPRVHHDVSVYRALICKLGVKVVERSCRHCRTARFGRNMTDPTANPASIASCQIAS